MTPDERRIETIRRLATPFLPPTPAKVLLALYADRDSPWTVDELCDAVGPEMYSRALGVHISTLRKAFGPDAIPSNARNYTLSQAMVEMIDNALNPNPIAFCGKFDGIIRGVAEKHGVTIEEIVERARSKPAVNLARLETYYELRRQTDMSLPAIGARMGNRDHTTVRHGVIEYCKRFDLPLPGATDAVQVAA